MKILSAGTEVRIIGGTQTRIGLRGTVIDELGTGKNSGKIAVYIAAGKHSGKYWYYPYEIEPIVDSGAETSIAKGAATLTANGAYHLPSEVTPSHSDTCPSSFEQLDPIQKSLYEYLSNCSDWVDDVVVAVSMDLPMPVARKHLHELEGLWIECNDKQQWRSLKARLRRPLSPSYPRDDDWDDALPRPEVIVIDAEFKSLIPPLSSEERSQLEENLLKEGCRDPLVVWRENNILLDGHNRFEICTHHNIHFSALFKVELQKKWR